jgi:hypothetical protein
MTDASDMCTLVMTDAIHLSGSRLSEVSGSRETERVWTMRGWLSLRPSRNQESNNGHGILNR